MQVSDAVLDACLEQDPDSRVRTLVFVSVRIISTGSPLQTHIRPIDVNSS